MKPTDTGFVAVNGFNVHYNKYGTGDKIVLLIPGAAGTSKTDFAKQVDGPLAFDLRCYTFIGVELPGWGRSRPPKRPYGPDVYDNDADCLAKLMENLGYRNYSIIGWSDGAKVALLMAILNPSRVQAVVASGIFIYCTKTNIIPTIKTQRLDLWDPELRANYIEEYGDEMQVLWDEHINFCKDLQVKVIAMQDAQTDGKEIRFPVNLHLLNSLNRIRCPVLLIQGDRDPLIPMDQPLYCMERIANCQLKRIPDGSHNLHQTHTELFRTWVDQFFNETGDDFF